MSTPPEPDHRIAVVLATEERGGRGQGLRGMASVEWR